VTTLEHFEQVGTRAFYRPIGQASFEQAVDLAVRAMAVARDCGCADLLVNVYGLIGIHPPTVFIGDVFTNEAAAVEWLNARQRAGP
jgi:hypothetical protein